jgi:CrcB protein
MDNSAMLNVLSICIGASLGALARWRLGLWLSTPGSLLPWEHAGGQSGGRLPHWRVRGGIPGPAAPGPAWRLALVTGFLGR